jgi:hypothetical protein
MTARNVVSKKKTTKSGKKRSFKSGDIWYDPIIQEFYLITKKYKTELQIKWLHKDLTQQVSFQECLEDTFVRTISSLEKELL